ncbi:MAG: 2-oxoglutarate dehydrogenase E1 component, partial [Rhodobacteraceae bacterium]|nr:2-oxoglutarate dehydrogenase E1 component [Paracoccaceae bacterium]
MDTTFLSGLNATFLGELYAQYSKNPAAVDPSWSKFFADMGDDAGEILKELEGASWAPSDAEVIGAANGEEKPATAKVAAAVQGLGKGASQAALLQQAEDSIKALALIRAYRTRGHQLADLDPLKLTKNPSHPELDYTYHGFTDADLGREIVLGGVLGFEKAKLSEVVDALKQTYCGTIGVEYMHIQDIDQRMWLQKRFETDRLEPRFTPQGKKAILERLTEAEGFEKFLGIKYTGTKRFGLDGGEALIPAIEQILKRGGMLGVKEVVLGMAHRGRLNVLVNVMHKPFSALFSEFQGNSPNPEDVEGSGDVKYH